MPLPDPATYDSDYVPERISLTHINSASTITAQFNPCEVEEVFSVLWGKIGILGGTSQPQQFLLTENPKINLELGFDAKSVRDLQSLGPIRDNAPGGVVRPEQARRFLMACCYPMAGAQDVSSGAPSSLLIYWTKMYSVVANLHGVRFGHKRFDKGGGTTLFSAQLQFEVNFRRRVTFEEILERGLEIDDIVQRVGG